MTYSSVSKTMKMFRCAVILLIGLACYLYSIFGAVFAETHLSLPFLDFPIFIGEILLALGLLSAAGFCQQFFRKAPMPMRICAGLYLFWLITGAAAGYHSYGPVALRNAALFYYPLFLCVGYAAYSENHFPRIPAWAVFLFLVLSLWCVQINGYFIPVYFLLSLGLILRVKQRVFKTIGLGLLLAYLINEPFLFSGSRSHMIGVMAMVTFLFGYFFLGFLKVRASIKAGVAVLLVVLMCVGAFCFGDRNAVKSMVSFGELRQRYREHDEHIQKEKRQYVAQPITPQLFSDRGEKIAFIRFADFREIRVTQNVGSLSGASAEGVTQTVALAVDSLSGSTEGQSKILSPRPRVDASAEIGGVSAIENFAGHDSLGSESVRNQPVRNDLPKFREMDVALTNILFRVFIWRDMVEEIWEKRAWMGVGLGQPQRSISIEILDWAGSEWKRDGWITPHNSFLHFIYRAGVLGLICVGLIFGSLIRLALGFLKLRSLWGGVLLASLVYWLGISNFLVFLELPYNAIPFWMLFGYTFAYYRELSRGISPEFSQNEGFCRQGIPGS